MLRILAPLAAAALLLSTVASGALAQNLLYSPQPANQWSDVLSEVRVGVHAHAAWPYFLPLTSPTNFDYSHINDISLDLLFRSPEIDAFRWIGAPRPNLGGTLNLAGKESMVHLGLTWQAHLFDSPVYVEGTLGAAANNGYLTGAPAGYRNMGCRVQFYEEFGVGTDIGSNATATLTYEHTSNAELCAANQGLSNFGLRIGYKF